MLREIIIGWILILGMLIYTFILGGVQLYRRLRVAVRNTIGSENPSEQQPTDERIGEPR